MEEINEILFSIFALLISIIIGLGFLYATSYFINWLVSMTGYSHELLNTKNIFIGLVTLNLIKSSLFKVKK